MDPNPNYENVIVHLWIEERSYGGSHIYFFLPFSCI